MFVAVAVAVAAVSLVVGDVSLVASTPKQQQNTLSQLTQYI